MADPEREDIEHEGVDPGWAHGTLIDARQKRVRCNYCGKEMGGGVYRLKQHIAGITGNVAKCNSCPPEVRNDIKNYMKGKKAERVMTSQQQQALQDELIGRGGRRDYTLQVDSDSDEDEDEDDPDPEFTAATRASRATFREEEERRRGVGASGAGLQRDDSRREIPRSTSVRRVASTLGCGRTSDVHVPGTLDPYLVRSKSAKQPTIKQAIKGVKGTARSAKKALKGIVKWFLHAGVPAHTASSPYFQTMVDAIAEAGPGLKAPTPRYIYDVGLDDEVSELKTWVDGFKNVWKERGCTIMCDGWTGTTRKSMINFLVYCSEGTIFLKSVDASNNIKNAQYLFGLMDAVVEEIGEEHVVQVVTDNEASYKAAGRLLMERRPHLYWVPCAAHCLDLMMEDIGRDSHVRALIDDAQMITSFIYSHNRLLAMMRQFTDGRDLLRPGPTRFASNFISLESLSKYRHQLAQFVNSDQFREHVQRLRPESQDVALQVQDMIGNSRFWEKISHYLKVIEPVVQVLRMVDGDDKNDMGYLYEAMDRAKERMKEKNPKAYRKWWAIIDARWDMTLHHDLHAAGYFFNPRIQYGANVHNDGEIMSGTINVITRLSRTTYERLDAIAEVDRFKMKLGIYSDHDTKAAVSRITPAEWWIQINYKQHGSNPLSYIAARVLSQTTSASQCERNWSTFSLIHTKIRNRLGVSRLEKLVYCHYNMRLRVRQIQERQKLERKRVMQLAGRQYDEPVQEIDVDELLDEEHPLHAWVDTRTERDAPDFDPADRSWAEGELDGVVPRDPEFRGELVASQPTVEGGRQSATLPETARHDIDEAVLRRSATQVEHRRKDKGPSTASLQESRTDKRQKKKSKRKDKDKSAQALETAQDTDTPALPPHLAALYEAEKAQARETAQDTDTPTLPPHLAALYDIERPHYRRRKKQATQVGSDDSTQPPDDSGDEGGGATAGVSGGYGVGGTYSGGYDFSQPAHEQGEGQEETQRQYGGYEGQQRQAGYDWEYGSSYAPFFQPPTLPYSDISSTSGPGYSGNPPISHGIFYPARGSTPSGESSSQQATTPRGIQRGFEDLAHSLFGYGPPPQYYVPDDEGSQM